MSTVINTNMFSINALREMNLIERTEEKAMERISSGMRINQAADDAAGIALLQKANAQITGYTQTVRNSNDAITMSQVADSAMGDIGNVLQRMRELSLQSTSSSYSDDDRESMQVEFKVLQEQIKGVINNTVFNGIPVLNRPEGQQTNTIDLQVGGNFTDLTVHELIQGVPAAVESRGYYATSKVSELSDPNTSVSIASNVDFEINVDGIDSGVIQIDAGEMKPSEWAILLEEKINSAPALMSKEKSVVVTFDDEASRFTILSEGKDTNTSNVEVTSPIGDLGILTVGAANTQRDDLISLVGLAEEERQLSLSINGRQAITITLPEVVKTAGEWVTALNLRLDSTSVDGAKASIDEQNRLSVSSNLTEGGEIYLGTRGGIASLGLVVHDTSKVSLNHYDMDDPADSL
ncbi:MAG TPA: flagellin, partial [Gammaproteobacteria bacterium]|nr:flagellin [Gammaproteobacteria bacterium]